MALPRDVELQGLGSVWIGHGESYGIRTMDKVSEPDGRVEIAVGWFSVNLTGIVLDTRGLFAGIEFSLPHG